MVDLVEQEVINIAGTQPLILLHETDMDKDGFFGLATSILRIQLLMPLLLRFGLMIQKRLRIDYQSRP